MVISIEKQEEIDNYISSCLGYYGLIPSPKEALSFFESIRAGNEEAKEFAVKIWSSDFVFCARQYISVTQYSFLQLIEECKKSFIEFICTTPDVNSIYPNYIVAISKAVGKYAIENPV